MSAYIECLVRNGIKLPPLNELNKHASAVHTHTPQYKATLAKCTHVVLG